jgi:glycosyltransferase involved in cell wall biosynthesis/uncharacterized SAM-binding protein YcdF (DUF218 family)
MTSFSPADLTPRDWVIISSINWAENWQMHQQLATALVDTGHRVLFIENTGVRIPHRGDLGRIWNRLTNWFKSTRGFQDVRDNLTLMFPLVLPLPYSRLAIFFNKCLLSGNISKWMRVNRFHDPVVVSFLPTPLALAIANQIDPALLIYYCANDMAGGSDGASRLRTHEEKFMSQAHAVFCISSVLVHRARQFNKHVSYLPPGVDYERFASARREGDIPHDLAELRRPLVGYVGAISSVFDQVLLAEAALQLPEYDFVLVGPACVAVDTLTACANIHLLGPRPHELIPYYIKEFSAGLIPYVRNSFTDAVHCCKLNEYLAMGVPVISTGMREVHEYNQRHGSVIEIANNVSELVAAIQVQAGSVAQKVDGGLTDELRERRMAAAAANSWGQRYADLCAEVQFRLLDEAKKPKRWQDQLNSIYRRSRRRLLGLTLLLLLGYGLLFKTPLTWLAGSVLVKNSPAKSSDAIVIFALEGEPSFVSLSYPKRATDALALYQAGHARRVFITSSRESSVSESEVIRALLVKQGVPAEAVSVLESTSRSMAESVKLTATKMRLAGIRKVLLVSAPYTSLRASLVWEEQAPDIEVTVPPAIDNPPMHVQWQSNVRVIRAVVYEYLAVAYYWIKGWL